MVEKNLHNLNAASSQAHLSSASQKGDTGPTPQKLSSVAHSDGSVTFAKASTQSVSKGTPSDSDASAESSKDSVASRRMAHGLSPKSTSSAESHEERRRDKEANAEDRKLKAQRQHKARVIRRTVIAIVLLVVVGLILSFWLLRWGLHDDGSSIQGKWRVQGTDTVIEIDDEEIKLTDEVAYDYVLDPEAKTLMFKFGALQGNGRYRFSLDHSMLAIDDGSFDAMGTLMADIPWTLEAVSSKLLANKEKSPSLEDGNMVLERVE